MGRFLTLTALAASAGAAAPVVFWGSDPVAPDETVLLLGGGYGPDTSVEVAPLPDAAPGAPTDASPEATAWQRVDILQLSPQSLKFVLPADLPAGAFVCRVSSGGAVSAPFLLNAPDPWWFQGDEGARVTPSGWLRVFGRCLDSDGRGQVVLSDPAGGAHPTTTVAAGTWALTVTLPADLAPSDYAVWVHNGAGGPATWRRGGTVTVIPAVGVKPDVFSVADFPGDAEAAIRAALARAAENGGGIVYLPHGAYDLTEPLVIPPDTILRGEGADCVSLHWPNTATPPDALITGARFGLEDLSIYCFNYLKVIADTMDSDRLRLTRVRVRAVPDAVRARLIAPEKPPFALLHLLGRNFQVIDCDLYAGAPGLSFGRVVVTGPYTYTGARGPWYGVIAGCRLYGSLWGCENLKGLIFENNHVQGVAPGPSTYWNNFSQDLYLAGNTIQHVYGGDREIFTSDAGGGAYFGRVAAVDGTRLTLAGDPEYHDYAPKPHTDYTGGAVMILDGAGAGQYRLVTRNEGRDWEVDRPWDIPPDETSVISIAPYRGHNLLIGNEFVDGGAVQLYGAALDAVLAGNIGRRIDGFWGWGLNPHGWGWQPAWRCQLLDNELAETSGYGARVWGPAFFGILTSNTNEAYAGPLARATVLRRCRVATNGSLRVDGVSVDSIVERCEVRRSQVGVRVGKSARGVLLRGNRFEQVTRPYDLAPEAEARVID